MPARRIPRLGAVCRRTLAVAAILLPLEGADAVEVRGVDSNPARFATATQSSTASVPNADTMASKAVDGNRGMSLPYDGCAVTMQQDSPWWMVDMGFRLPIAVVRIFGRNDEGSMGTTNTGLQLRIGDSTKWSDNQVCWGGEDVNLEKRSATVVNCIGTGQYLFVVAPNSKNAQLGLCEVEVIPRGPTSVNHWEGTVGQSLDIGMEGNAFGAFDRIRILKVSALCGEDSSNAMDVQVLARSAPWGPPSENDEYSEVWRGIVLRSMGFYKVCWCSGLAYQSCAKGQDFSYIAGFIVITGQFRTIVGPDILPFVKPSDNATIVSALSTVNTRTMRGIAVDPSGTFLWFSEEHRVREVSLRQGLVYTIIGSLTAKRCLAQESCGDGGLGTQASLFQPAGLAWCNGQLLIADSGNHRIRSYDLTTRIIRTVAGTGAVAYSGDGGPAVNASLNGPMGVTCDPIRGFWIADTGNNAIRYVSVPSGATPSQVKILRSVGGMGDGVAQEGDWSTLSYCNRPNQLVIAKDELGYPRSVAYAETSDNVTQSPWVRYVPLVSNALEGPIQTALGNGEEGYRMNTLANGDMDVSLRDPEGVAVDGASTMFIADTGNHRLLMKPFVQYRTKGCFREYSPGAPPLIPSLEGDPEAALPGKALQCSLSADTAKADVVAARPNAVQACARAAINKGFQIFAVRCGGVCASAANAGDRYGYLGPSDSCSVGRGAAQANTVYELVPGYPKDLFGQVWTLSGSAFVTGAQPNAAFSGDWSSSWVSSVSSPSQLVYDPTRRNLYVVDRGNARIRAIMGTLGPSPTNQAFRCTNGLACNITVAGNALSSKDQVAFSRVTADGVICGLDRLEVQFPSNTTGVNRSDVARTMAIFSQKDFPLGRLELREVGTFQICYCYGGTGDGATCTELHDFEFPAGVLTVVGPNSGQDIRVVAGPPFDVVLFGNQLTSDDSIRLVPGDQPCGQEGQIVDRIVNITVWWVGCFMDDRNRDFKIAPFGNVTLTNTTTCAAACWSYAYIAMQFGICRCGNAYSTGPTYAERPLGECNTPCDGEDRLQPTRFCGAPWRNAVYRIKDNSSDVEAPVLSYPTGTRTEGTASYEVWSGVFGLEPTELNICWCSLGGRCKNMKDFSVFAGRVVIEGPDEMDLTVQAGTPFDLLVTGTGGFRSTNRIRLQPADKPCRQAGPPQYAMEQSLPQSAMPCALSATSARWCNVVVNFTGQMVVCWCGAESCLDRWDFRVSAGNLTVVAPPENLVPTAGGPFYRPPQPVEPLNTASTWPPLLYNGSKVVVTIQAWTRQGVPGSASPGPVDFYICETPQKCLRPVTLTNLFTGAPSVASQVLVPTDPTLAPTSLWVRSRTADAWLPEYVDVGFGERQTRRFPLNRWLLDTGSEEPPDVLASVALPMRTLPAAADVYTEGDSCGGCPVGFECLEVPLSRLALARLGLRAGAPAQTWGCQPVCGDGMVAGEEQCDDGNREALDGCSSTCQAEAGLECFTEHGTAFSVCRPVDCSVAVSGSTNEEVCPPSVVQAQKALASAFAAVNKTYIPNLAPDANIIACRPRTADLCRATGFGSFRYAGFLPEGQEAPTLLADCGRAQNSSVVCGLVAPRPRAVHATFAGTDSLLSIAFDAPLNRTGVPPNSSEACTAFFHPATVAAFGDQAACFLGSPRHLVVGLGFGATVGMDTEDVGSVALLDAGRQYDGLSVAVPAFEPWNLPVQRISLRGGVRVAAGAPESPVVVLRGPPVASVCGDTVVDGTASRGSNGLPWVSVVWDCAGHLLCNQIALGTPCSGFNTTLSAGAQPDCLVLHIQEFTAASLGSQGAVVTITLTLTNAMGVVAEAEHTIRFTARRVPLAIALSPSSTTVPANASAVLRLEVAARAPDRGSCPRAKSLGPLGVTWRLGDLRNITTPLSDLASVFNALPAPPDSLTPSHLGVLEGQLGPLAVPGAAWLFVARVAYASVLQADAAAGAEPAFVAFNVTVAVPDLDPHIEVPTEVAVGCPFTATVSHQGAGRSSVAILWSCLRTDLLVAPAGLDPCAGAAAQQQSYMLPGLAPGIYQLQADLQESRTGRRASAVALVAVHDGGGPNIIFHEQDGLQVQAVSDAAMDNTSSSKQAFLSATVDGLGVSSCLAGPLYAAVTLIGLAPDSATPIVLDTRVVSSDILLSGPGSASVEAAVALSTLMVAVEYRFQVLVALDRVVLATYIANLATKLANGWLPPAQGLLPPNVWMREGNPFMRTLPPPVAIWVEPLQGIAARTLFHFSARAVCEDCLFAYRLAPALPAGLNPDGSTSCALDDSDGTWQELKPASLASELKTSFLAGNFTVEVRAVKPDGGASRACVGLEILDASAGLLLVNATDAQDAQLINAWIAETSATLDALRTGGQLEPLVASLRAIAQAFPNASDVSRLPVQLALRTLFGEICDSIVEALMQMPVRVFSPSSRRLQADAEGPLLQWAAEALFWVTRAMGPTLMLSDLWQTLATVSAFLNQNLAAGGVLGSSGLGRVPAAAAPLLSVTGILINLGIGVSNSTHGSLDGRNATALVAAVRVEVGRLGDAVAAALAQEASGPPVQVASQDGTFFLSVKHISGMALAKSGFATELPLQGIHRAPYPAVRVPALGVNATKSLKVNASLIATTPVCLGAGVAQPMDAVVLVVIQWVQNPWADALASSEQQANPPVLLAVRDVSLRTCGVTLRLTPFELGGRRVEFVTELPESYKSDSTTGYGRASQFRCSHWEPLLLGTSGIWQPGDCIPTYRPWGTAPNPGVNVSEGAVHCACTGFWPTTWALEVLPPPILFIPSVIYGSRSGHNLVTYAFVVLVLMLLPLLVMAGVGDLNLGLDSADEVENAARLLPWAVDRGAYNGARSLAMEKLANLPWVFRNVLLQETLTTCYFLSAVCQTKGRSYRSPEVLELPERRELIRREEAKRRAMRSAKVSQVQASLSKADAAKELQGKLGWRDRLPLAGQPAAAVTAAPPPSQHIGRTDDADQTGHDNHTNPHPQEYQPRLSQKVPVVAQAEWGEQIRAEVNSAHMWAGPPVQPQAQSQATPQIRPQQPQRPPAPPQGWIARKTQEHGGRYYWVNLLTGKSTWVLPTLPAVKELSVPEMRNLLGPRADQVHLRVELEEMLRKRIQERYEELEPGTFEVYASDEPLEVSSFSSALGQAPGGFRGRSVFDREFAAATGPRGFHADAAHRAAPPPSPRVENESGMSAVDKETLPTPFMMELRPDGAHWAAPPTEPPPEAQQAAPPPPPDLDPGQPEECSPQSAARGLQMDGVHGTVPPVDIQVEAHGPRAAGSVEVGSTPRADHLALPAERSPRLPEPHGAEPRYSATRAQVAVDVAAAVKHENKDKHLRVRLEFLSFSGIRLVWVCWLRACPFSAALVPRLVQPRLARAAALSLRLSAELAVATGIACSRSWEPAFVEDVQADKRSIGTLLGELDTALGLAVAVPSGLACVVLAAVFTALYTPSAVLGKMAAPARDDGLPEKVAWFKRSRRRAYLGALSSGIIAAALAAGSVAVASTMPQPRASVATGMFIVALLVDLLLVPIYRTLFEAFLVGFAGRPGRCGRLADFLFTQFPSLLDFRLAQVFDWTSSEPMIARLKAVVEEQRLVDALAAGEPPPHPLGMKAKRETGS